MKKLSLVWAASFALTSLFLTSCKDEEVDPKKPTINFVGASTSNQTVKLGEVATINVVTAKGDKNLDKLTFRIEGNIVPKERIKVNGEALTTDGEYKIKATEDAGKTYVISFTASATAKTETLVIAVSDNDNLTNGLSAIITTSNFAITSATAKLLGAQSNAAGSYFDATGSVIPGNNAKTASNIVFSYASLTAGSSLVSPLTSDRTQFDLTTGSDNSATTYFAASTLDFAAVTGDQIATITASTSKSVLIENGKTYSFVQGGVKGLVKVTGLVTGLSGSVTVDVKWVSTAAM